MRRGGIDLRRALGRQGPGAGRNRTPRVDHVVDQDARLTTDIALHDHPFDLVGLVPGPPLVNVRHLGVEQFTEPLGHLDPPGVRRHHDQIVARQLEIVLQVVSEERKRREVIDGEVEEPLDLTRVEVHGHDSVGPSHRQQVCHQPS